VCVCIRTMSDNGEISHIGRYVDIVVKRLRGRFPSYWGRKKRRTRPTRHHSTGEQTNLCCCEDSVMTKHMRLVRIGFTGRIFFCWDKKIHHTRMYNNDGGVG